MRVVIVEDERPAADELAHLLSAWPEVEIAGTAINGPEGFRMVSSLQPDAVFLDIEMPGMSGLELAERLMTGSDPPEFVYVTAYDEYALQAFEVQAIDYLVKPIEPDRLAQTVSRLLERFSARGRNDKARVERLLDEWRSSFALDRPLLSVPAGDHFVPVFATDVILATTEGRNVLLVTDKGEFRLSEPFTQLAELLQRDPRFYQCHRGYVVNLRRIVSLDLWFNNTFQLQMERTDVRVPVSRSHVARFREIMNIHK